MTGPENFPNWTVHEVNTWDIPSVTSSPTYFTPPPAPPTIDPYKVEQILRNLVSAVNDNAQALRECQDELRECHAFMRWIAAAEPEALDRWRASVVAERLTA